jgi:hypothetical protein
MALTALLALVCIIIGFVGFVLEEQILMPGLAWFVLAIAFNTLGVGYALPFGRKSS